MEVAPSGYYCKKKGPNTKTRRCQKYLGSNAPRAQCEAFCDEFGGCLAYSAHISKGWCLLFTVQTTCLSGWDYRNGEVITSVDELDWHPSSSYSGCYAKGKTKIVLNMSCTIYLFIHDIKWTRYHNIAICLGGCCEIFEMTSAGGVNEKRSSYLGFFHIQENKINGRPHYTNENGKHLYRTVLGNWMVIRWETCSS